MTGKKLTIAIGEKNFDAPLEIGADGTVSININRLREQTGYISFDPDLRNTATVKSAVTWIDSEHGTLLYRGYNVKELVEHSNFPETAYLLGHGELPNKKQQADYSLSLSKHSMIHEAMRNFFDSFPAEAHPLAILSVMVTALSSYYPVTFDENIVHGVDLKILLLAKIRTLAAWSYKKSIGHPIVYPRDDLPYCENFLNMIFSVPTEPYKVPVDHAAILNQFLILYADHEQNVSTTTVRLVGSTRANLFACISAGLCALWGSRESGASIPARIMLAEMTNGQLSPEKYFANFINGNSSMRSTGLGHDRYTRMDPRAMISKTIFHAFLKKRPEFKNDPLIQKGLETEEFALGHPLFIEKNLYPNLDFYSALAFHMLGIPMQMNNVVRTIGKLSGWLAHWQELRDRSEKYELRPRQVYDGHLERPYMTPDQRS